MADKEIKASKAHRAMPAQQVRRALVVEAEIVALRVLKVMAAQRVRRALVAEMETEVSTAHRV